MPAYSTSGPRARRSSLIALVIATAVLYLAAEVLIPLAIAILLAFLAAPAVRSLERWKMPRLAATGIVCAVGFGVIFAIGVIAAVQAVSLAAKLPEYRHNITTKIQKLRHPDKKTTIGIPNALLFGLLGMLLRFVPYIGVWLAAAMPAVLAFAISDGWTPVAWTLGVFAALELLLAYVIEPWLYGKSAGLSPVAIIAAVMFWTWLWGPIGLLLATPLTVCVAVVGRHIPELGYLNVLLGVDPVLSPEQRFYQRLLALDHEEAQEMVEQHAAARWRAKSRRRLQSTAAISSSSRRFRQTRRTTPAISRVACAARRRA